MKYLKCLFHQLARTLVMERWKGEARKMRAKQKKRARRTEWGRQKKRKTWEEECLEQAKQTCRLMTFLSVSFALVGLSLLLMTF